MSCRNSEGEPISSDTQLAPASLDRYQAPPTYLSAPRQRTHDTLTAIYQRASRPREVRKVPNRRPTQGASAARSADGSPAWSRLLTFGSTSRGRIGVQEVVGDPRGRWSCSTPCMCMSAHGL